MLVIRVIGAGVGALGRPEFHSGYKINLGLSPGLMPNMPTKNLFSCRHEHEEAACPGPI